MGREWRVAERDRDTVNCWTANAITRSEHAQHLVGDGINGVAVQALLAKEMGFHAGTFQSTIHVKIVEANHAISSTGPRIFFVLMQQPNESRWLEKVMPEQLSCGRSVVRVSGNYTAEESVKLRVR